MARSSPPGINDSPFTKLAGVELTKRGDGYSQVVMKVTESVLMLVNGSVHGGAIATLLDVGMGTALRTRLKDDEMMRTVQLQVNYLSAASSGVLICESKIIHKGTRIATLESEVRNEESLVAKATGTYYTSKVEGD